LRADREEAISARGVTVSSWPRLCKNARKNFEFNDDGAPDLGSFVPALIAPQERRKRPSSSGRATTSQRCSKRRERTSRSSSRRVQPLRVRRNVCKSLGPPRARLTRANGIAARRCTELGAKTQVTGGTVPGALIATHDSARAIAGRFVFARLLMSTHGRSGTVESTVSAVVPLLN
jgi:hypothetical protein